MIKVSIIVPVYNVEAYLAKCLDSLMNQTLQDIEIIVVNDGATDGSQKIIDEYVKKSNMFQALMKSNGGLSDARNYGIPHAVGEYIGFVDSDDYVDPDMFEILYQKAKVEDSDIVECNLRHTYPDKEDIEIGREIYDKQEMIMFGRSVVWNKIYKRDWLLQTKVVFPKGLVYEDLEFFVKLVPHIRTYSYVKPASIHYVQRNNSINNTSTAKTLNVLQILKNIHNYYLEHDYFTKYQEALEYYFSRILLCSSFSRMCCIEDKRSRKEALEKSWDLLSETFPNWGKNKILKETRTHQALFMRTVNKITYRIYSIIFPAVFQLKKLMTRMQ
jgi:glycosyltransferase involved in cell wall biosynthesis